MKSKIIKKVIMSSLCLTLCFGLIQSNVMAAEVKSRQVSNAAKLVEIQDGKQKRKDIVISEADKEAALSNKLSSKELEEKYGSKNNVNTTTSAAATMSLKSFSAASAVTSSVTGSNSLSGSFKFLSNSSLYGGDQDLLTGSRGPDTGCGPITGCNILAYHAKYYNRSNLYPYKWVKADWIKYQDDLFRIKGGIQNVSTFDSMLTFYAYSRGYSYRTSFKSYYLNNSTNLTSLCNAVKSQIDKNNPVAMLIGTRTAGSTYKPDYKVHWVTITGYNFNNGNTNVTVSSWGSKDTLSLAQLLANRTWIDVGYAYKS